MIKAMIIDDEEACRSALKTQLTWSCPNVDVIAEANDVETGISAIRKFSPDLVFLDIEMPGGTGFDLLQRLESVDFDIIFTTAYDEYAMQAFKVHAQAYLLKPVDEEDLKRAIDYVQSQRSVVNKKLDELQEYLTSQADSGKIAIPVSDGLELVFKEDILRCESEGSYCHIYLQDQSKIFIAKTLKQVEAIIADPNFLRVHHSHLVNKKYVRKYIKGSGGQIIMTDHSVIPVSRNKKDDFLGQF